MNIVLQRIVLAFGLVTGIAVVMVLALTEATQWSAWFQGWGGLASVVAVGAVAFSEHQERRAERSARLNAEAAEIGNRQARIAMQDRRTLTIARVVAQAANSRIFNRNDLAHPIVSQATHIKTLLTETDRLFEVELNERSAAALLDFRIHLNRWLVYDQQLSATTDDEWFLRQDRNSAFEWPNYGQFRHDFTATAQEFYNSFEAQFGNVTTCS